MKKFLFFLVLGLVIVLLATPWIFGSFTERRIEQRLEAGAEADPGIVVITEEYRRRWFSSDSRHRIVVTDPSFAEVLDGLAGGEGFGDQPALVVETRIDHGPLPLASGDEDSVAPGLSRAVSTFAFDPGKPGQPIALPGKLVTVMALDGATDATFTLDAGSRRLADGGGRLEWEGALVEAQISADGRTMEGRGRIEPIRLSGTAAGTDGQSGLTMGAITFDTAQRYTAWGIPVGPATLELGSLEINDGTDRLSIEGLRITSDSEIAGDLLSGTTAIRVERIEAPLAGTADLALDMAVQNLHVPSAVRLSDIARELESRSPPASPDVALTAMEADLATLVAAGPILDLRSLVIGLPDGDLQLRSYIALAAGGDPAGTIDAADLVGRLTTTLELRVPQALLTTVASLVPEFADELQMLISMGVLREDGNDYRLQAEYGNRLLTINGLPVPIPFGL